MSGVWSSQPARTARSVRGRILAVAADTVELTVEGGAGLTLPLAELTRARVEVEFGRVDELDELDECDELHDRDDASEGATDGYRPGGTEGAGTGA